MGDADWQLVGRRVRALRRLLRLTQAALAAQAGVSRSLIAMLETGVPIAEDTLDAVAGELHTTTAALRDPTAVQLPTITVKASFDLVCADHGTIATDIRTAARAYQARADHVVTHLRRAGVQAHR